MSKQPQDKPMVVQVTVTLFEDGSVGTESKQDNRLPAPMAAIMLLGILTHAANVMGVNMHSKSVS